MFFTDARCPKDNVVGGLNNGWNVAMTTLGFERGTSATTGYRRFEKELDVDRRRGQGQRRHRRSRSCASGSRQAHSNVQIMRINGLRSLTAVVQGKKDAGVAALGATNKMFWSEYHQRGAWSWPSTCWAWTARSSPATRRARSRCRGTASGPRTPEYPASALQSSFFFSRSETIWGGTAQIQRNIVGERFLGLPKEPKVDAAKK